LKFDIRILSIAMTPLYTENELMSSKNKDKLPLRCEQCDNKFYLTKEDISRCLNPNASSTGSCCSLRCSHKAKIKITAVPCKNCNIEIMKLPNEIKRSKTGNTFCSRSCSAKYNNKHRKCGTRVSKLEVWIQAQLTELYPDLEIHFNKKDAIGSELDIYIPSMRLAVELNGIFHYEPIYGNDKLKQIQNNDSNKFQMCQENNISLCIIDTTSQNYFKEKTSQKFLDIITNIIG